MMKTEKRFSALLPMWLFAAFCIIILTAPIAVANDPLVKVAILHLNDLYEITPSGDGAQGGLARVAALRKQLLEQNPNTFMLLAGDLFSPSALGTAIVDGDRLAGRQMVAVLNEIGLNYCTFGNHEFDLREPQFLQRLKESKFTWFSSNVFSVDKKRFPGVAEHVILTVNPESKRPVRIGMIGLTIDSNPVPYVHYADPISAAREQVLAIRGQVDILIAVTHLRLEQDIRLAEAVPELDLILGGHEHENVQVWRGPDLTPILKADANARTVYVHDLLFNTESGELRIHSRLQPITSAIPEDPKTAQVAQHWVDLAFAAFKKSGFNPQNVVANVPMPLDGLESSVRHQATNLTENILAGMLNTATGAELAIFNSGSIRIDDVLPPGNISEYDVIRILPFGGVVLSVEMKGSLLGKVLDQGWANKGSGGFLHAANVSLSEDRTLWMVNGNPLDTERMYQVAINDFLLRGLEQGLEFLNRENKELRVLRENADVRKSLIEQLKRAYAAK
jgi:5'-nucleotidase